MVNLKAKPYYLSDEEKVGQLFVNMVTDFSPETHKRVRIHFLEGDGRVVAGKLIKDDSGKKAKALIIAKLEERGFIVEDGDAKSVKGKMEELKKNCDAVLVFIDQVGFAQYNAMRVKWTMPVQQPWYAGQVPTAFISLYLPNYLIDLTMSRTYINCYNDSATVIETVIEKLCGESGFKGLPEENVWCGRWDTKL